MIKQGHVMQHLSSRRLFMGLAAAGAAAGLTRGAGAVAQGATPDLSAWDSTLEALDVKAFSKPTVITNKWMPQKPGMRYVYEGTAVEDDGKVVPHKIEINITDLVKVIGGVANIVSYDLDISDNELVEAELAFFAQDDIGNVWHFGQYPEEYEDGKFIRAPAWIHGYEHAYAGIMMKAEPKLGTRSYSQGYGPAVGWTDRGTTYQMGQDVSVRHGRYTDVMVVRETAKHEGDAYQLKYYAPGVGNIKVGWMGSAEKTQEMLELVKIEELSPKALADVRAKAMALEKSAYARSKTVYALTKPMIQPGAAKRG